MHYKKPAHKNKIKVNQSYLGETIEQKINRIVNNKEPITDGAPNIYTERRDGVMPEYDIRTDRFEIAVEAMNAVNKTHKAKREERAAKIIEMSKKTEGETGTTGNGGAEPTPQ